MVATVSNSGFFKLDDDTTNVPAAVTHRIRDREGVLQITVEDYTQFTGGTLELQGGTSKNTAGGPVRKFNMVVVDLTFGSAATLKLTGNVTFITGVYVPLDIICRLRSAVSSTNQTISAVFME